MKCLTCKYLVKRDNISLMSQMMGFTAECSKTGTLFNLEKCTTEPLWCPLAKHKKSRMIEGS
jgi:hypothetical protein